VVGSYGILGWVDKVFQGGSQVQTAAGKIMELLKAVIYFAPRAKRYEHSNVASNGRRIKSSLHIFLITQDYL